MVTAGNTTETGPLRDVIAAKENADAAYANENANDLGGMVADMQEDERNQDDHDDSPEIYELG